VNVQRSRLARVLLTSVIHYTPFIKGRFVDRPLQRHLQTHANSAMDAQEYGRIAYDIGYGAPYRAIGVIKHFIVESPSGKQKGAIPDEKKKILEDIIKPLKGAGRFVAVMRAFVYFMLYKCATLALLLIGPSPQPQENTVSPDSFPHPLEVRASGETYTIYGQEAWNAKLRSDCQAYFSTENYLQESQLKGCFAGVYNTTLEDSQFLMYLQSLQLSTIKISEEMMEQDRTINQAVLAASHPDFTTESTSKDERVREWLSDDMANNVDYALYYTQIYLPQQDYVIPPPIPSVLKDIDSFVSPDITITRRTLPLEAMPVIYRVVRKNKQGNPDVLFIPLDINDPLYACDTAYFPSAAQLTQSWRKDISLAASILYDSYADELSFNQLSMLLQTKLTTSLATLRHEDPWQDKSACLWSGCSLSDSFERVFNQPNYGVPIFGHLFNLPWRQVSWLTASLRSQGFGPYQIIFGLFEEAAKDAAAREHFKTQLLPEDFTDEKAMLRTIFEKPTMSAAFVVYHVIAQLKNTTFKDPMVRISPTIAPYISDPKAARQFSLMSTTQLLLSHPERDSVAPFIAYVANPGFGEWQFYADILGEESLFPNMAYDKMVITSSDRRRLIIYVSGTNDPNVMDHLKNRE